MSQNPNPAMLAAGLALPTFLTLVFLQPLWVFGYIETSTLLMPIPVYVVAFLLLFLRIPQVIWRAITGAVRWLRGYGI